MLKNHTPGTLLKHLEDIAVRNFSFSHSLSVRPIALCSCGKPAVVHVGGLYKRCQPCANRLVNLWNETRANLDGAEGDR